MEHLWRVEVKNTYFFNSKIWKYLKSNILSLDVILKNFKHVANGTCLEEWIQKSTAIFYVFSYKCDLVKCCCLVFRRDKKSIFVTLNTNISQSAWWKILKFFPYLLNLPYYKILRLHVFKNDIFQNFGTCTRNGSFV